MKDPEDVKSYLLHVYKDCIDSPSGYEIEVRDENEEVYVFLHVLDFGEGEAKIFSLLWVISEEEQVQCNSLFVNIWDHSTIPKPDMSPEAIKLRKKCILVLAKMVANNVNAQVVFDDDWGRWRYKGDYSLAEAIAKLFEGLG